MKKIKLESEEFLRPVINYMLREYGVDYDYVKKNSKIKGVLWCQYYWDTLESKKEFLDWLRVFIKTNVNYKPHKIESIISQIDLMWGLKVYES